MNEGHVPSFNKGHITLMNKGYITQVNKGHITLKNEGSITLPLVCIPNKKTYVDIRDDQLSNGFLIVRIE